MKKISILLAIALMAIIYSCGNGGSSSNKQKADSLAIVEQVGNKNTEQAEPQITLTVKSGKVIRLELASKADSTLIRIVSGKRDTSFMIGTESTEIGYLSGNNTMTIYGNITKFDCVNNGYNLTAVDFSKNTGLTSISVFNNSLSSLDVSKNTALTSLRCGENKLKNLDVSNNKGLKFLFCEYNLLTDLDLSNNTALSYLIINDNSIKKIDLSKNKALSSLEIGNKDFVHFDESDSATIKNKRLISLDVSHNTNLSSINSFELSIECYNSIIKSLPDRRGMERGEFEAQHHDFDFIEDIDTTKNWSITTRSGETYY